MLPVPFGEPQLEPGDAVQFQVALVNVTGRLSATAAPVTALGPALLTTIVYVVWFPGTSVETLLVLVIAKSTVVTMVLVSVALLFAGVGSGAEAGAVTVAVLVRVPVAELTTVAFKLNVVVAPGSRLTVVLMLPLPLAAPQLAPADGVQVQLTLVSLVGTVSVTVAPLTVLGPLFLTTMV